MKKVFIILIVIALGAGLYYGLIAGERVRTQGQIFGNISFFYPEDYVALKQNVSGDRSLEETLIVMQKSDYESVLNGERDGGEGPASIVFQRFHNSAELPPQDWAEANPRLSNFNLLMGEPGEKMVAERSAFTYEADGLYASRNVVFAMGDKIYVVSGHYLERDSDLYRTFDKVISSIEVVD